MKLSEFIADARDHLAQNWAKGTYRSHTGGVCGISALERAAMQNLTKGGPRLLPQAQAILERKIREITDGRHAHIPTYNDAHDIDQQDMLNLMDKAIIGLEESGQ
jgi:hypothetical protein